MCSKGKQNSHSICGLEGDTQRPHVHPSPAIFTTDLGTLSLFQHDKCLKMIPFFFPHIGNFNTYNCIKVCFFQFIFKTCFRFAKNNLHPNHLVEKTFVSTSKPWIYCSIKNQDLNSFLQEPNVVSYEILQLNFLKVL
jgi:hypothetical protein